MDTQPNELRSERFRTNVAGGQPEYVSRVAFDAWRRNGLRRKRANQCARSIRSPGNRIGIHSAPHRGGMRDRAFRFGNADNSLVDRNAIPRRFNIASPVKLSSLKVLFRRPRQSPDL